MAIPLQREPEIEYPDSDGKPMAESSDHARVMRYLIQALSDHFAGEPDVFAWGNMLLYYEEGKLSRVAPDLFVVRGIPAEEERNVYLLWNEGKAPCFVLEVTSAETRDEDEWKKALYAQLGVEELFLFDPRSEYLQPYLQGFHLNGGEYQPLHLAADGGLTSQTIGITFRPEGRFLRMIDVKTGDLLLTYKEWKARAEAAIERAEAAKEREERAAQAEERAEAVNAARRMAEERAEAESAARRAAEERAAEAEARARALAEELERFRRPS